MIRWWLPPEQRQEKKKRQPYRLGLKAFLTSFVVRREAEREVDEYLKKIEEGL